MGRARAAGRTVLRGPTLAVPIITALLLTACGPQPQESDRALAPGPSTPSPSTPGGDDPSPEPPGTSPDPGTSPQPTGTCRALNEYYHAFLSLAMATTSGTWGGDTGLAVPRATLVRLAADAEQSLQALRDPEFVAPVEVAADLDRTLAVTAEALEALIESDDDLDLDQWFADYWTDDEDERASERVFAYIETHCHPNGPGTAPPDTAALEPPGAAQSPSALPAGPDRHVTVHLPDGREFLIGVGSDDTGAWVAEFLGESMSMLDPTAEEVPGALDYHGSGYVDAKATLFTPVAQLRDALPDWSVELFDVGDDLVAEHLAVTDPATGISWCIDIPDSTDRAFVHRAGGCDLPSDLAPVGPPRRPTPDGP